MCIHTNDHPVTRQDVVAWTIALVNHRGHKRQKIYFFSIPFPLFQTLFLAQNLSQRPRQENIYIICKPTKSSRAEEPTPWLCRSFSPRLECSRWSVALGDHVPWRTAYRRTPPPSPFIFRWGRGGRGGGEGSHLAGKRGSLENLEGRTEKICKVPKCKNVKKEIDPLYP